MAQNSDVIVVGAGINGLLVSRMLIASGASVTLIEKHEVAKESSWAGGGIVSPLYPWRYDAAVTALANWAQAFYPQLAEELLAETGIDVQLHACGLLMLDAPDQQQALVWAATQGHTMLACGCDSIYKKETALAAGFESGLWMPQVGNIRNPRLCRALLASLQKQPGFSLMTQAAVTGFMISGSSISGVSVKTAGEAEVAHLFGGAIVITAGAWSQQLLEKLSLQTAIQPVKGQMLLYKFPKPPIESIILNQGKYLIPRQDGHLLVGSTLEYAGFDKTSTSPARQTLSHSAVAMLPALEKIEPVGQWAGLRPGSTGGVPYIGRLEPYSNFYINAGQFRNGLVLAPASARLTADIVLGVEPEIDPAPFDLRAHRQDKSMGFEEKSASTQAPAPASSSDSIMT